MTSGRLVIDATDNRRSTSATTRAHLYKRRAKERGGYMWGPSWVLLVVVTPNISIPVGFVFSQPAPELRPGDTQEKALKQPGVPPTQRPPTPAPHPQYPTHPQLARRLREAFKAPHPAIRIHGLTAEALDGTAPCVDDASAMCGGVHVLSPMRSTQNLRVGPREPHVADYVATHPGTPHTIRIRGGDEVGVGVSSARLDVCAHKPKRFIVAIHDEEEAIDRDLIASDLRWRTRDLVQGPTLRWRVEVFMQDGKSSEGWRQLTTQPGDEGARPSVILRLLVDHALCLPPDPHAQLKHNLPAYTVGRLRANGQVQCLVELIDALVLADDPQENLTRFTQAWHEVCALGRSKTPLIQRQLGRRESTPSLKYRADEVMRNMPVMST